MPRPRPPDRASCPGHPASFSVGRLSRAARRTCPCTHGLSMLASELPPRALPQQGNGPGRSGWQTVAPEKYGINGTALEIAANELHSAAAVRNCTLIVKDGYIIYEKYDEWSDSESIYESDSMGECARPSQLNFHPLLRQAMQPPWPMDNARVCGSALHSTDLCPSI